VPEPARGRADQGPILIGYDGSEHARRAIEAAHALVSAREAVVVDAADPILAYAGAQAGVDFATTGSTPSREVPPRPRHGKR
jgi:hypothetical protein